MAEEFNIAYDPDTIKEFNAALKRYVTDLGKDMNAVIKQWSGNLAENLMMETPPFADARRASNGQDARKNGLKTLRSNIKKSIKPAGDFFGKPIKSERLKEIIRKGQKDKLVNFMEHAGYGPDWKVVDFDKKYHQQNRPTIYRKMKGQRLVTLNNRSFSDYVKRMESLVGWMKSGWAVSAIALGKKVTNWIANNVYRAPGKFTVVEKEGKITYTMENHAPTISIFGGRYNYAIEWMFDKMNKDIEAQLRYLARKKGGKL